MHATPLSGNHTQVGSIVQRTGQKRSTHFSKIALLTLVLGVSQALFAGDSGDKAVVDSGSDTASNATLNDTGNSTPAIVFEDCYIGANVSQLRASCASVQVPLDPDNEAAGQQTIAIARIKSRRQSGNKDALTMIAGGPGQSAIESFPAIAFAFRHIMRDRDLILVDQRGTGDSGSLQCPEEHNSGTLDTGAALETDLDEISAQSLECLQSLTQDTRLYTTSVAVRDLEDIRIQLGITQWNLYGISYGTRVAMHYLRRYPTAVRTMTLDAIVPPQLSLGPDIGPFAQQSLEKIFQRCEDDKGCGDAFGNLTAPTLALLDELEDTPRTITYEDIATGQLTTKTFTRNQLAATLRLMSYSSQTAAILPSMLFDAIENGNLAPLARQAEMQNTSLGQTLSTGMHHAVVCTEDVPFFADTDDAATQASYLGDDIIGGIQATCKNWPAGIMDEQFKQPLESDTPTLILSGGADPITPPVYGELAMQTLGNAKHIVNESQSHMQAPFGCMPSLLAQFVETADAQSIDTECLQRLRPTPFFVDANGPLP